MPRTPGPTLFDLHDASAPAGFRYIPDFITRDEHDALLARIEQQRFGDVRMHGGVARRTVVQYGWRYSFDRRALTPGDDVPAFLHALQSRCAALVHVPPAELSEVLVTRYPPGATIGWHRDAPAFEIVIGVSLLSTCRFRFRRGPERTSPRYEVLAEPRSVYVLAGAARWAWQHSIPPTPALRYSVTFRTLRSNPEHAEAVEDRQPG